MTWFVFTSGQSRSDSFIFLTKPKPKWGSKHPKQSESRCCFPLLASLCSSLLPWGQAALPVCRIQVYTNATTPKYGLLENSGAGTQPPCSHTNSRHFTYVKKKKISKILKTITTKDWTMPNPTNAFPKFSSVCVTGCQCSLWEVQPQYCSHPASLHPLHTLHSSCLAISLSRDCTEQNCTHSLRWPWHLSFTTVEPEGGNTTPLKILLKQHFLKKCISQQSSFCVFCRLPCSQPYQHLKLLSETWMYCWQDNQFKW